jgi:hypothetical protein
MESHLESGITPEVWNPESNLDSRHGIWKTWNTWNRIVETHLKSGITSGMTSSILWRLEARIAPEIWNRTP